MSCHIIGANISDGDYHEKVKDFTELPQIDSHGRRKMVEEEEEEATEDSLTVMLLIHQLHEQRNTQNNFLIYTLISSDPSREISKMTNYDGKGKRSLNSGIMMCSELKNAIEETCINERTT
jgi:hypothetical protein